MSLLNQGDNTINYVATDENGCTIEANILVSVSTATEDKTVEKFQVWPNPVVDVLTVSYTHTGMDNIDISIYNASGQRVFFQATTAKD